MRRFLENCIDQALGRMPADLVIGNVRLFNLVTGTLKPVDIAICGDRIVGIGSDYQAANRVDGEGRIAVPGFIDTHVHCESSLVTPLEFEACVLPRGTTTAISDPHEICNVLGTAGLDYMLACAGRMVMDLRVQLSSCVPATHLETAGARMDAASLAPYRSARQVVGLAEMMNFPGLLAKDPVVIDKLALFQDGHIDGHAPMLGGRALDAYLACRIRNCHETTSLNEAREKLEKGMHLLIREGTVCKDLAALAPALTTETSILCSFCTDDRNPLDIAEEGHIDHLIRRAIALGVAPLHAYRAASFSAARGFGLTDRGLLAPGQRADIILLDDLHDCAVARVIARGMPVEPNLFKNRTAPSPIGLDSVRRAPIRPEDLRAPAGGPTGPVIGILQGKIVTEFLTMDLPWKDGLRHPDPARDVLKVAVLERHGVNGNIGRGFVKGFGIADGALAASVGHDSHNICVVGSNDSDMALAVNHLIALGGGFVAVQSGAILGSLALPMAGLISLEPFSTVRAQLLVLQRIVRDMGSRLPEPFLQLAFLPLPVIPHLKITDRGLVDVDRFELIPG
ncbi:adenine deaminase [Acidiphilium sp. AL]|uniref:adenine deaminase n=1 Tax=Acidiphilium sp. AL TaxID=2871704 RepID=UPI0021CB25B1|nr:adenine deaminase [Acidiphilium sp. AL]MCU4159159.1 adenine deaminase [Acidiphilium sp. AL]